MTLQVVVISREIIKPSLPTPKDLRSFSLSHVDQYVPPIHVPLILFYPVANKSELQNAKTFARLKTSLSETLTHFFPLAGRVNDNELVKCNDQGVEYVETQVGGEINQVVKCPEIDDLNQLIPCDLCTAAMGSTPLVAIQVNKFDCGGVAITVCVSHKITDAASLCIFINSWAKTVYYGSSEKIVFPQFDAATIFPPRQVSSVLLPTGTPLNKVVGRRFVFDSSKISALKAKACNASCVENPTRVEAIVALIWKCALKASQNGHQAVKKSAVNLGVNLRGRLTPSLPDHSFGNLIMGAISSLTTETDLQYLVGKLREAKRKLDEDLQTLPVDDVLAMDHESMREFHEQYFKGEVEFFTFTSWCRFPFYEADFGWGKPIWATCVNFNFRNIIIMMDTESGDGIETWVNLEEQEMARFECDEELLTYAHPSQAIISSA